MDVIFKATPQQNSRERTRLIAIVLTPQISFNAAFTIIQRSGSPACEMVPMKSTISSKTDRLMARTAVAIFTVGILYGMYAIGQPIWWRLYATVVAPFESEVKLGVVLDDDPFSASALEKLNVKGECKVYAVVAPRDSRTAIKGACMLAYVNACMQKRAHAHGQRDRHTWHPESGPRIT